MHLEVIWDEQTTPVDLADGTVSVGGSPSDDLQIPGLPDGLLRLIIEGERVMVTSIRALRIGAAVFPARLPRLWIAGEDLRLPGDVILRRTIDESRREARKAVETMAVVRELFALGVGPEQTRAASLTCVTGADQGAVFPVAFEVSAIGRAVGADVRIHDRAVSRRHASLRRAGRRYFLGDVSATNGVYLNGVRVQGQKELTSGDVIELGQTLLRFDGPERAPGEVTTFGKAPAGSAPPLGSAICPVPEVAGTRLSRRGQLEVGIITVGTALALLGGAVTFLMLQ